MKIDYALLLLNPSGFTGGNIIFCFSSKVMVASHKENGLYDVNIRKFQFEIPNFNCFLGIPNFILMHCSNSI